MTKFEKDIARVFGGKDNEPITDELIKELVSSRKFEEKDLRWFPRHQSMVAAEGI